MSGEAITALETLRVQQRGAVCWVQLHRPEVRNAMSLRMVDELLQVLRMAERNASRVLVLRGSEGHFCAGGDLKDMAQARLRMAQAANRVGAIPDAIPDGSADAIADPIAAISARYGDMCVAYAHTGLATVAVLEGTVMGGGFGLACVADVALADDSAVFRLPETSLGVVPAQIAPFLVERLGYSQARRLAVTGARLDAQAALALGLVHAVHGREYIEVAMHAVLADILACAPQAVAATKALMRLASRTPAADMVALAAQVFSRSVLGEEGQEGTAAFLQKRKPQWASA